MRDVRDACDVCDVRRMVWCHQWSSPRKFAPTGAITPARSSSSHHALLLRLILCAFLLLGAHTAHAAAAALAPPTPTKCDMSVGEWRYSKSYPRYVTCPYVRSIFNCRGNGRKDQLYEKQRWVPDKCSLPRFSAKAFLAMMRGKTVGFVGDSLMSNMWESFVCLLYASGVNLKLVQKRYGGYRYVGFYIPTSNTTIVYRFSAYLMQAVTNSTKTASGRGKHGYNVDLDVIDPALMGGVANMNVVVLTSGTWWQANVPGRAQSNVYRIKGQQVYLKDLNAHKYSLDVLRNYLGQFSSRLLPYFISLSPSHKWDQSYASKPGVCGSDHPLTPTAAATILGNSTTTLDYVSAQRAAFSSPNPVRFIDVTAISTARPDGHTGVWGVLGGGGTLADGEADDTKSSSTTMPGASNGTAVGKPRTTTQSQPDCRHWCLPGVPDSWVDVTAAVWQREPSLLRK
ncbi:unnamed protein product [Closterium sp. NIES-53]